MRVRAVACPDCGRDAEKFEVDVDNQRRSRVVAECTDALDRALSNESPAHATERPKEHLGQFLGLAELPSRFLSALEAVDRPGHGDLEALVGACTAIGETARDVVNRPAQRPWIRTEKTVRLVAEGLVDMTRKYLAAFAAATPLQAQRYAEAAQHSLDLVAEHVAELNQLRERWETLEEADDVGDWIAEALADASKVRGINAFADLDKAGRDLYYSITGRRPGEGTGLGLLSSDLFSQYVGDEDAFRAAISAADLFLERYGPELANALSRQIVVDELRNGFLMAADQARMTNAVIASALNDRQAVRATLDLMHTLFEGPGRRMVALMLDIDGTSRFEESLPADGAATIRQARARADIGAATYGFDAALRIAEAHQSYEVQEDHLLLRMRKKGAPEGELQKISLDDLLDRALASVECMNAIALVIQAHAMEHGVNLVDDETLAALGAGPAQLGAALLRASNYSGIEFDGPTVRLTGPMLTGAAVIAISLALPSASVALIVLTTGSRTVEYEVNIEQMRESSSLPEGLDKEFHFQRLLGAVRIDGKPGWSPASMQRWLVGRALLIVQSGDSLRDEFPTIMRELRRLVTFATEEDLSVAKEITALRRYLRLTDEGRTSELDPDVFDRLGVFVADDIPNQLPFDYDPVED